MTQAERMTTPIGARGPRRPFEPGSRMWEEVGLVTFSLTAGTAFLLQTMEPTIAAVVDEHSTFRTDPVGRALRSIASVQMWVYGGTEALAEADRLREMHASLNTTDAEGTRHTALSAGPWAWVLLTGAYAFLEGARYFARRPLTEREKEDYYAETVQLLRNFSVSPKHIPATYAEFLRYFDEMVRNQLRPSVVARDYLNGVRNIGPPLGLPRALRPLWRMVTAPVGRLQYFVTVGTTPEPARRALGLRWSEADERRLRLIGRLVAYTVPLLPERLRYFPIAYRARRVEHARRKLRKTIDARPI
ncbi:oxygenase MpaB family protein [Amycolatopsis aidingensis]|uniref:oxygenase MpaB family protein n=1 Tax=Amycolatopsis aidingensis TaxID=2842453 RepID=UPI001C0C22BE|nr:oxygenase MpaB family protein [Amycolatopsis aidingensis]